MGFATASPQPFAIVFENVFSRAFLTFKYCKLNSKYFTPRI